MNAKVIGLFTFLASSSMSLAAVPASKVTSNLMMELPSSCGFDLESETYWARLRFAFDESSGITFALFSAQLGPKHNLLAQNPWLFKVQSVKKLEGKLHVELHSPSSLHETGTLVIDLTQPKDRQVNMGNRIPIAGFVSQLTVIDHQVIADGRPYVTKLNELTSRPLVCDFFEPFPSANK